jgi:hypothetical protein
MFMLTKRRILRRTDKNLGRCFHLTAARRSDFYAYTLASTLDIKPGLTRCLSFCILNDVGKPSF